MTNLVCCGDKDQTERDCKEANKELDHKARGQAETSLLKASLSSNGVSGGTFKGELNS